MKSIKYFAAAAVIAMTSFATFAAEPVDQQQASSLTASAKWNFRVEFESSHSPEWPGSQTGR